MEKSREIMNYLDVSISTAYSKLSLSLSLSVYPSLPGGQDSVDEGAEGLTLSIGWISTRGLSSCFHYVDLNFFFCCCFFPDSCVCGLQSGVLRIHQDH